MYRIPRDKLMYGFDASTPPVVTISPGDAITVETHDTSTGRIHREDDLPAFVEARDPIKVNPAGGPIFVEGAEPGDALAVRILSIELGEQGFVRAPAGVGVLQDGIREHAIVMVQAFGDQLIFGDKLRFTARPMVGVLGTAPAEGTVFTAAPGSQGSNMDFNAAKVGATVYLPVHVEGGLLGIGDVHASMGDGEVSGTGIEISADVMVRVELLKSQAPERPWIENDREWIATGQGETLEIAVNEAVEGLTSIVMKKFGLDRTEAFLLVSARGDVRIGQAACIPGLDATVYAVFDKDVKRLQ